jgi:hypothetical protein
MLYKMQRFQTQIHLLCVSSLPGAPATQITELRIIRVLKVANEVSNLTKKCTVIQRHYFSDHNLLRIPVGWFAIVT